MTVEPLFDEELAIFKSICARHQFHVAKLLMQKRKSETADRSQYDSFCTTRSQDYNDATTRMLALIHDVKKAGIKLWRYKVEDTIMDSRIDDVLGQLKEEP